MCRDARDSCDPLNPDCTYTKEMDLMFPSPKKDREFDPQVHGCVACGDGRWPCGRQAGICAAVLPEQAQQSKDQEPFTGIPVLMAHPEPHTRRYNSAGLYVSPAEEEMVRLSSLEQAIIENTLHAEREGVATAEECARALASAGEQPGTLAPNDMVHLPAHYARFKIEPIRFIVENGLNWFQGNIVKYSSRAEHKHETPIEDISKIIRYAEMWREFARGNKDWWR